jgi:hypothetical protein
MAVQITRLDPMASVGSDSHAPAVLSVERFDDMDAAIASLRARGIPLTDSHVDEFKEHPETQFAWNEFVMRASCAYSARVSYDVRQVP